MPVIEPEDKPRKKALFTARVYPTVVETLRAYCEFLNSSSQHHVVEELLSLRLQPRQGVPGSARKASARQTRRAFLKGGHVMLRTVLEYRGLVSAVVAAGVWSFGHLRVPFPATNDILVLVAANAPHVHAAIRVILSPLWFTSPLLVSSFALSLVYIFFLRARAGIERIALPRYPELADRTALFLVLGEIHKERRPTAVDQPRWLTIPRRALFTGIGIFGAVGSGKTTCCMYPFAEQLLAYRRDDPERRIGGLVLEVKGDFCYCLRETLRKHGREDDYIELSLDCPYRYNPLYNDLEAYALAYGIASLLTNLFGRGKEPFWQQAYTNVVKFIVLLHKSLYGYVTLFDVYECAINPDLLSRRVAEGQALFEPGEVLLIDPGAYHDAPQLRPSTSKWTRRSTV